MSAWWRLACGLLVALGGSVGLAQYQSLHDQNETLFRQLQQVHGLSDDQMKALRTIFARSGYIGQGNPAITRHPVTPEACQDKLKSLGVGESGTGKDLAAKVLHYNSGRAAKPFMNITCSALPDALLESELFGHERGAFTGADRQKRGLLEMADGGTVFLDEIGEMVPGLQAKLLRFLEEKAFKRVGGSSDIRVDVRVVGATNRNLQEEVRQGKFREDLFYRLNVLPIPLPPLRERRDDIPLLVAFYVDAYNTEFKKRVRGVDDDAMRALERYAWPGNIRELRNAIERAMLLAEGDTLTVDDVPLGIGGTVRLGDGVELPAGGIDLEQLERSLVVQALERTGWNQTKAAALLGVNRDQIRYRIEKFHLEKTIP